MKIAHKISMYLFACSSVVSYSQAIESFNEGGNIEYDYLSNVYTFSWWGKAGRTYFVQLSSDLDTWAYLPEIEVGMGGLLQYQFNTTADRIFVRLQFTDQESSNPIEDDFDEDGVNNLSEILQNTDPLSWQDLDGDGLPDDWEVFYGLTPSDDNYNLDLDGDGLVNGLEFSYGSNPENPDTDGDGLVDGLDVNSHQSPTERDHPDVFLSLFN